MRISFSIIFIIFTLTIKGQTELTISGKTYNNTDDTWLGVNIPRSVPTALVFKNNSITSINRYGYMLQAGDEGVSSSNNNLKGAVITGNKFNWSGSDMTVIPHGLFTGHNINVIAKYNYLNNVPMGIIRKSASNMSNTGGGVAYNIVKGGLVGMVIKGMSNVNVYNNTFYNDRTTSQTWRPLLHIYTNTDGGNYSVSHGTKIYNNIFYTKYGTLAITIADAESLTGLKCDYNVYWCENGSPKFNINGSVKSLAQWQAMGFDVHSVVINPQFRDYINFVPSSRLDFGTDLGPEWVQGLAPNAVWGTTDPATTTQNGKWQVGAIIHPGATAVRPGYLSSLINKDAPSVLEMTYDVTLANVIPPASAFNVVVNSVPRTVNSVNLSGNKVLLTLISPVLYGEVVTVSYTKPATNFIQSITGGSAATISAREVMNSISPATPVYINSVIENASPSNVEMIYSCPLATIIPADSVFFVQVNNTNRQVKSVTVSGNKVNLKLTETLKPNDIIKISYIKPSVNPIQSKEGATAESIADQPVTNNIDLVLSDGQAKDEKIFIYPNPAKRFLNIEISDSKEYLFWMIRIFDFSGKLCMEKKLEAEDSNKVLLDLKSGFYIVQVEAGSIIRLVQKLIVVQ